MSTLTCKLRQRPIIAGLLLKGDEGNFLASCASLARELDAPLELVHVLESGYYGTTNHEINIHPFFGFERVLGEVDESLARRKIEELSAALPRDIRVHTRVLRDFPAAALCALAHELKAGLIVCGVQQHLPDNLFSGLSTAFSLASNAEVPVLLLHRQVHFDFHQRQKLLIADNLEIEGRFALENALRIAEDLNCQAIYHTHVHKRERKEIVAMLAHVETEMKRSGTGLAVHLDPELYLELLSERIKSDLIYRFHNSEGAQHLAASYDTQIAFGEAARELHKIMQQTGARLLVFGRHHLIHHRGFSLGKVPYKAMIKEGVATFIVPDNERQVCSRTR